MRRHYNSHPESGSVIYWIFIAVALFAALSFTVSKISRTGNSTGSELSRLRATEIIQYAGTIQRAIRIMAVNGIGDSDLCFHTDLWGHNDYDDSGADNDCGRSQNRIFDAGGGAVSFQDGIDNWYADDITLANGSRTWVFSARYEVEDVGTTSAGSATESASADILMATAPLREDVCRSINNLLGFTDPAPPATTANAYDALATDPFNDGAVSFASGTGRIGALGRERCVNDGTSNMYYKVILAR